MKKYFVGLFSFCVLNFFMNEAMASWADQFGSSVQNFKVYVVSDEQFTKTQGYFLTSFPCYGEYSQEFYRTNVGSNNMVTLRCIFPPKEIYLSYSTAPISKFVPRNAKAEGYMLCPVNIVGRTATSIIPRMQVKIEECEKSVVNPNANREIIQEYNGIVL